MRFASFSLISHHFSFSIFFLFFCFFFPFFFFFLYISMSTFKVVFSTSCKTATFVLATTYWVNQPNSFYYCSSLFFQVFIGPLPETSSEISRFCCYRVAVKVALSPSRSSTPSPWIIALAPRTSSSSKLER